MEKKKKDNAGQSCDAMYASNERTITSCLVYGEDEKSRTLGSLRDNHNVTRRSAP